MHFHAAIKSDLKNLASQQEIYFADSGVYTSDRQALGFVHSNGVELTIVASPERWTAFATHTALGEKEGCSIYVGATPVQEWEAVQPGEPGEIACTS